MFKTYSHAELSPAGIFGEPASRHWKFIELELHHRKRPNYTALQLKP